MKTNACVLLYNLEKTEKGKKVKFILIRMGIHIKNIAKEEYLKPIGTLAGIPDTEMISDLYVGDGFNEEMLVMKGFTEQQLNQFLTSLRKEKVEKIDLKAVITSTNQTWNSLQLYEELKKEHAQMNQ